MFWFCGRKASEILAPQQGIEPAPPVLESKVLTTGLPGSPWVSFRQFQILSFGAEMGHTLLLLQGQDQVNPQQVIFWANACPLLQTGVWVGGDWQSSLATLPADTRASPIHSLPTACCPNSLSGNRKILPAK